MTTKTTAPSDFLNAITAFERQLCAKAKDAGLSATLVDNCAISISGLKAGSATLKVAIKAGHGMDRELMTIATSSRIGTVEDRDALAGEFVQHMELAIRRAPAAAASRTAIARAAEAVFGEAGADGIDLELLRLEPAPIHVYGKPRPEDDHAQVFYVHVVMPHLSGERLTRDSYTIDADEAEEFADYVRNRTLPELRDLVRDQGTRRTAA